MHAPMPMQCFIHLKGNFEKKTPVFPIEKFLFLVLARNAIMLQHFFIHSSLHYLSSGRLREINNKGKFQTFSSTEVPKYINLTWKHLVFWKTGR